MHWISILIVLAQAADGGGGGAAPPAQGQGGGAPGGGDTQGWFIYMMGALAIFILVNTLFGRSDTKEKAKRDKLIGSLKKNDPVVTIGGILGTVVSVSEDLKEVTIRVDDNSRLKMQASAIREVLVKETKEPAKSGE